MKRTIILDEDEFEILKLALNKASIVYHEEANYKAGKPEYQAVAANWSRRISTLWRKVLNIEMGGAA